MKADVGLCIANYISQWSEHLVVSSSLVFGDLEVRSAGKSGRVCQQSGCYKATGSDAGTGTATASDVSTACNTVIYKRHGFVTTTVRMSALHTFSILFVYEFSYPIEDIADTKLLHALLCCGM